MKIGRVLQGSRVERGVSLCFPAITRICIATCCSRFLMKRERERKRVASIVIWRPTWLKLVSIFVRARVRRNQTLYALNSKLIGGGKNFEMEKRDS